MAEEKKGINSLFGKPIPTEHPEENQEKIKSLIIKLPPLVHRDFKTKAANNQTTMQDQVLQMIKDYIK